LLVGLSVVNTTRAMRHWVTRAEAPRWRRSSATTTPTPGPAHAAGTPTTHDHHPLSARSLATLFTDGTLLHRLLIADGQIIDRGRSLRLVSPNLRDAMVVRDHGCRFPNCDAPTAWIHAHHLQHWEESGTTDLANLDDDHREPSDHDTALLVRARVVDLVHRHHRHHRRRRHPHRPPAGLDGGPEAG